VTSSLLRRYWLIGLVAVFGIVASLVTFHFARVSAEEKFASELSLQAENRTQRLQEVLSRYEGTIEGFAATFPFASIDETQLQDYARAIFVASSMLRSGLQSVSWAPRVLDGERDAFEAAARREGLPEFRVLDLVSVERLRDAARRPEYYVLRYSAPEVNAFMGLDLLSEPERAAAIREAIAKGSATATAPVPFRSGGSGIILYVPVFKSPAMGQALHRGDSTPLGVLAFRLAISATIDSIVKALEPVPQGLDMYVLDDAAPAAQRVMYARRTGEAAAGAMTRDEAEVLVEPYFGSSFAFAGRDWTLIVRPSPALLAAGTARAGWSELGSGITATALLTIYLVTSRRRAERMSRLASELQQEVAERRNAQEQLRLTQIAMDRSSEAICLVDPAGHFVHANDAACVLLGYSRAELLALTVAALDPGSGGAARWSHLRETGSQSIETHYQTKSGRIIPIDLSVSKFEFNDRAYHLMVARDATLKRQVDNDLRHAKEEAEKANRAKSEFLANMSHELRTPLNAIIGFSEMLKSQIFGPVGGERYRGYVDDILRSGRHLLKIINDILDMSKVEAGKMALHEETVDLASVILACIRLLTTRANDQQIELIFDGETDLPPVWGDALRIKQALLNVMTNAVKFSCRSGRVTVSGSVNSTGELQVIVQDTGIGMTEEGLRLALEPFTQVDNALTRRFEGTGLGLPLTNELIKLHDGRVEIDSRIGAGTTVRLILPAHRVLSKHAA
jgi:PAS domain S-box-containing protein